MKSHFGWAGVLLDLTVVLCAESVGSYSNGGKSAFLVSLAIPWALAGFRRNELLSLDTSSRIYYLHPHVISPTAALFPTAPTPLLRSSPSLLPIYTQTQTSPSPSPSPPIPPSTRQQSRNPAQEKNSLLPLEYLLTKLFLFRSV